VVGIHTPEMKYSGIIVAWTIGWAASGEPIIPATAYAMQANVRVPSTVAQSSAPSAPIEKPTP